MSELFSRTACSFIIAFLFMFQSVLAGSNINVSVADNLQALLQQEDTDNDKQITIEDNGIKRFLLKTIAGKNLEVAGTYPLSNLLQELALAREAGLDRTAIDFTKIYEKPVNRISRMISEYFWDGLMRKMDKNGLEKILADPKMKGTPNLYIPYNDKKAWEYYSELSKTLSFKLFKLPQDITPEYVFSLNDKPGLLALAADKTSTYQPLPFVVPGGRFNEMYGWDSYFINIGLLLSDRIDLARAMVDNHIYQVNYYGKILNANRTYYLTRSQPPFLTSMVKEVYDKLEKTPENKQWLKHALLTCIKEYEQVWMTKPKLTDTGLSRYYGTGIGMPPETEPEHFDSILKPYAEKAGYSLETYKEKYLKREISNPELDQYFVHDRAMRESGHDTSNRLIDRCANLNTADLNSLLYKYEMDIAKLIETEFSGTLISDNKSYKSTAWYDKASKRKTIMYDLMWNTQKKQFFDYDFRLKKQTGFESLTNLYPLWAGLVDPQDAKEMVKDALRLYEEKGGLVSTTKKSRGSVNEENPQRQWDYPNGWAPHQILLWVGLQNYGFEVEARRLAYCWMYTITRNAVDYNGTVPEKYDVVTRTHKVFAEYGNVGTDFDYITKEGFGWMNSSYLLGQKLLSKEYIDNLNQLIPPEWIFEQK